MVVTKRHRDRQTEIQTDRQTEKQRSNIEINAETERLSEVNKPMIFVGRER